MVAYNFKKQFAEDVESGRKRQTIRAGEPRCKPGDALQLYTGQQTKACRKLRVARCERVRSIIIESSGTVKVDGLPARGSAIDELARADGFENGAALRLWFINIYGLPFHGHVVNW